MKNMIKRIIIGIFIAIGVMFFKNYFSFAATIDTIYLNGGSSDLTTWWYKDANQGSILDFRGVGLESQETNIYFNMLMCTDATSGTAWATTSDPNTYSLTRTSTSINFTDIPCYVRNTNYKTHVVQVQSVTRTYDGDIRLYFHVSFNQNASISVNSYSFSDTQYPLVYSEKDYTSQLNAMSTNITNAVNNSVSNMSNAIQSSIVNAQSQTNTWLEKVEAAQKAMKDAMENDDIEENNSQFNEFKDYLATNGVITNLISLPVTLFTKVLDTIDGTCTTYSLGNLYDSPLELPCIDISDYLGSTLWNIIDILISGLLIYSISRHFIKMFNKMSSLEESDIID